MVVLEIADLPVRGTLRISEELAPGTARGVVHCVDESGNSLDISAEDVPNNDPPLAEVDVAVGEAGNVFCDWYTVPAAPATDDHAVDVREANQVLAQGVARVPRRLAVWRLVRLEVVTLGGGLAFNLPESEPLTVTWEDGRAARFDLGDAAFVGEGERVTVVGQDGASQFYLALQLVPAETVEFAPHEVIALGDDFLAPTGKRTLELVGGTLDAGASTTFDPGIAPALLVVTQGTLEVRYGRGSDIVAVGSAVTVGDAAALVAIGDGPAAYVAARVGAQVAGLATPTPMLGEVAVVVYDCPAGMRPETIEPALCRYTTGPLIDLRLAPVVANDFEQRSLGDARLDGEVYVWDGLPFATYVLQARALAEGYDRYLIPGQEGLNTPPELGYTISPNEGYLLPIDAAVPGCDLPVYVFRTP